MRYAWEERVTHDQMHLQEGLQDMCILPGYAFVPQAVAQHIHVVAEASSSFQRKSYRGRFRDKTCCSEAVGQEQQACPVHR